MENPGMMPDHLASYGYEANLPLLDVQNLSTEFATEYGVVKAVSDVSFQLFSGETLGIVGESGSGKSVTMLSIMGLIQSPPGKIAAGQVLFEGQDLLKLPRDEMRSISGGKIAIIFQDPMTSLNPVFTIGDQICEAVQAHMEMSRQSAMERAADLLNLVGIPEPHQALRSYPHQFSGGMRQRAMIAMALSCNPTLLIADEPTTALDVTVQEQLIQLIQQLQGQFQMAIIWITHDLGIVSGIADRILVMYAGKIVESSSVYEIFDHPRHPYTQGLLQSIPRMDSPRAQILNMIPGAPPNLIHIPKGCAFAPRCKHRIERCIVERPLLVEVGLGHSSACWVNPER
jgi:oligopeptide transport system ATP-binding protein